MIRKRWHVYFGGDKFGSVHVGAHRTERGARKAMAFVESFVRLQLDMERNDDRHWVEVRRGSVRWAFREVRRG